MAPKIQLDPRILSSQGDRMDSLKREFDGLFRDVSGTLYDTNYNWSEYLANNFSWKINSAQKSFSAVTSMLESGAEAARNSAATFSSLDDSLAKLFGQGPGADMASGASAAARAGMASMTGGSTTFDFQQGQNGGLISPDQIDDLQDKTIDALKDISKLIKEAGNKEAGIFKNGLSYMEDFVNFLLGDKSGLSGTKDWCDLTDSTLGLWKGMYDYLFEKYEGFDKFFSKSFSKKVGGIGVASDVFGLISSLCGAMDTISSSNEKGFATTAGEIIGEFDSGVDLWGSVLKYIHVNDEAINITTKGANGIYSPLSFYTAIVKGGISTVSQAFKSVGKYSADGKFDLTDAANTGVEASVHGLGSMIDSLTFGLGKYVASGMTLGFISPDEFTADNISAKLENGSADLGEALAWGYDDLIIKATTGTKAGEYIQNDPELKKKFRNAGRIGQAALTFYAAAKSLGQ